MRQHVAMQFGFDLYSGVKSPAPHDHYNDLWCLSFKGKEFSRGWLSRDSGAKQLIMSNPTWKNLSLVVFSKIP